MIGVRYKSKYEKSSAYKDFQRKLLKTLLLVPKLKNDKIQICSLAGSQLIWKESGKK